jgi:hypothetical protein
MKPMEPMEPMEPMKPMEPYEISEPIGKHAKKSSDPWRPGLVGSKPYRTRAGGHADIAKFDYVFFSQKTLTGI